MYRFMLQEDVASYDLSSIPELFHRRRTAEPGGIQPLAGTHRQGDPGGLRTDRGFCSAGKLPVDHTQARLDPAKPSPLYDIVLQHDDGTLAKDGEQGALVMQNLKKAYPTGLFVGYYKNPEMTQEILGGGSYCPHDVFMRDKDGYYWFVGRNDDVIKCSGYRIGPFEVESALIEHPAVLECAITAAPDPIRGQVVKADCCPHQGLYTQPGADKGTPEPREAYHSAV